MVKVVGSNPLLVLDFLSVEQVNSKSTLLSNTIVNSATSASESVFMYDFLLAMAYELGIGWDAVLSYRFMNMDEYESFDDLSVHLFELGLGKNF